jgi:hypothetical protein
LLSCGHGIPLDSLPNKQLFRAEETLMKAGILNSKGKANYLYQMPPKAFFLFYLKL